jgi:tetratricopeptide (TPR) repeat protein
MLTRTQINILSLHCLAAALIWLGGCAGLTQYGPAEPPLLSPDQQTRVGEIVAGKLIQVLGGPYHDERLAADLNRLSGLQAPRPPVIAVADRSAAELYPLLGGRIVMTRGLLARMRSRAELDSLLHYAAQLAGGVYRERMSRSMVETAGQVLSAKDSVYDPEAPAIRLARLFARNPCGQGCLAPALSGLAPVDRQGLHALPESVRRLAGLQPGFELLASARESEQRDDQGKAIATYLQAAAKTPDEPYILGALGLAYLRAEQLQPARLHLQKAVALQPDYYRTLMGLGYLSLQQEKYKQANEILADSVRLLAVAENLFLLAEAREKSGDTQGAMALYRLVAESDRYSKLGRSAAARLVPTAGAQ